MLRKVSTLLFLTTCLAAGACEDEIVTDAIPVSDAAVDRGAEAPKEGGDAPSTTEGGPSDDAPAAEAGPASDGGAAEAAPDVGAASSDAPAG